jgi:hypothetical protein
MTGAGEQDIFSFHFVSLRNHVSTKRLMLLIRVSKLDNKPLRKGHNPFTAKALFNKKLFSIKPRALYIYFFKCVSSPTRPVHVLYEPAPARHINCNFEPEPDFNPNFFLIHGCILILYVTCSHLLLRPTLLNIYRPIIFLFMA